MSSVAKTVRHVKMLDGVTILESKAQKDEYILEGNDVQNVSQSGVLPYGSYISSNLFPLSCVNSGHLPCTEQGYP